MLRHRGMSDTVQLTVLESRLEYSELTIRYLISEQQHKNRSHCNPTVKLHRRVTSHST
jgi:hypothetical protein